MNQTNSKKILIALLSAILFICIFITTTGFVRVNAANAFLDVSFSPEEYTVNDALLLPDGSDSDKDIKDFSDKASYKDVPAMLRISSDLAFRRALKIIESL